jgi:Abortive infection C-terminus
MSPITSSAHGKPKELFARVEELLGGLMAAATGGVFANDEYQQLRKELLAVPRLKEQLPSFLKTCRDTGAFWSFIKPVNPHWEGRRQYLRNAFEPALSMLEAEMIHPADESIAGTIAKLDSEHVAAAWRKALDRVVHDPEGAITAARTLIESVCKHVLDEARVHYDEKDDLPKLYGLTAELLNLGPSQHTEQIFKQILGGCKSVVEGLGALRNKLSDAHGKGKAAPKPSARHARLAVNLAESMATFIASTWEARSIVSKG